MRYLGFFILLMGFLNCSETSHDNRHIADLAESAVLKSADSLYAQTVVTGELLYVPVYSNIYYFDSKRTINLTATLSIHNINMEAAITVSKIDYYNQKGELIKNYLTRPIVLTSLETKHYIVEEKDVTGGTGANFIVEWYADAKVSSPLVDAVMISTTSSQGVSFRTTAVVIKSLAP